MENRIKADIGSPNYSPDEPGLGVEGAALGGGTGNRQGLLCSNWLAANDHLPAPGILRLSGELRYKQSAVQGGWNRHGRKADRDRPHELPTV